jgi:hypothetical protein
VILTTSQARRDAGELREPHFEACILARRHLGIEFGEQFPNGFIERSCEHDDRGLVALLADVAGLLAAFRPGGHEEAVRPRALTHGDTGNHRSRVGDHRQQHQSDGETH